MSKSFGGSDPFDDPFFTRPFDYIFGGRNPFNDPFFTQPFNDSQVGPKNEITIEEINPDDDEIQKHSVPSKELAVSIPHDKTNGTKIFSYQKVAYGGLNGMYYTSAVARRTGGDGVVEVEMKEEDKTMGEALHTISRGISDKGHSVTTKHNSDGRVDSIQTLHNLNEDELGSFEEAWKVAGKHFPGWNNGLNLLENAGASSSGWDGLPAWGGWGLALPWTEQSGNPGAMARDSGAENGDRRAKKVVPINIE